MQQRARFWTITLANGQSFTVDMADEVTEDQVIAYLGQHMRLMVQSVEPRPEPLNGQDRLH
jgi:hypothetical protein